MAKSLSKSFSKSIKSAGDFKKISHDVLHNRPVLYFIFIIAVGNLFHFVFSNDLMSVGVFIAAGLLTSFFSKNMVVIMVVAMVVANIVRFSFLGREGFRNKKTKEKWETAMEEMFSDAMNEAFEEEDDEDDSDDSDDGDDGDDGDKESDKKKKQKQKKTSEEFTTRFEGFETKEEPSLEDRVKKIEEDVKQIKLDM